MKLTIATLAFILSLGTLMFSNPDSFDWIKGKVSQPTFESRMMKQANIEQEAQEKINKVKADLKKITDSKGCTIEQLISAHMGSRVRNIEYTVTFDSSGRNVSWVTLNFTQGIYKNYISFWITLPSYDAKIYKISNTKVKLIEEIFPSS